MGPCLVEILGWLETVNHTIGGHVCVLSCFSRARLCMTPWTAALQAPLSMGFSRQEYWSGVPYPPPRGLTNPGIRPMSLMSPALAYGFFTTSAPWEAPTKTVTYDYQS